MATCTILSSDGTPHAVSNLVLDSAGTVWEINGTVLDSAGTPVVVCVLTTTQFMGGEDPEHKRRRYRLMDLRKEDDLILLIIKQYMN